MGRLRDGDRAYLLLQKALTLFTQKNFAVEAASIAICSMHTRRFK